jgi:hypothetical protein
MTNNYELLIARLDEFIRKYYLNQLLRGLIYTSAFLLALFLAVSFVEFYLFLPSIGRGVLFYGYLGFSGFVAFRWVILPGMQYARLGKVISHEQAAKIIGTHFANVEDRLLNILQLKRQSEGISDASLINASISQKIENLKPVPFATAIDLSNNRKYLKYLAVPLSVLIVILVGAPRIITEGSTRLVYNGQSFEKPAPFKFIVANDNLNAIQYSDFELRLKVEGDALPNEVSINQGGYTYKMQKDKSGEYAYKFFNLQKNVEFNFSAAGFDSKEYELEVTPKPMIVGFNIALDYPSYIGRKDEVLSNTGDITVPEGTKIIWDFNGKSASDIAMYLGDTMLLGGNRQKDHFVFTKVVSESMPYTMKVSGTNFPNADSITYIINVTPDQYPVISVTEFEDSVDNNQYRYFTGDISDDYGLRSLSMKYKVDGKGQSSDKWETIPLAFNKTATISPFNHYWDLKKLGLQPGDEVTYYFEVWDNDAINGSKSGRTPFAKLKMPTVDQLDELTAQSNESLKDQMESAMKDAKDLQKDLKNLQEKMIDKKNLSWEDKKAIEDMMEKQNQLQQNLDKIKEEFSNNQDRQNDHKEFSPEVVQKQQQLEKLFNEVLNDELKELFNKLDKMMEDLSKQDMMKEMENFEMTDEQLEKELDRMLSLFKQLEMEQKMDETIKELDKLAKKQEDLSKETEGADGKRKDELAQKQEELNKEFDKIKEQMDDLDKLNEESGEDMPLDKLDGDMSDTEKEMDDAKGNIGDGKNKKASQNQKNAADKMKKMSDDLAQMQQESQQEQDEMDMQALRQLLDNLLKLSFDQEELMATLKKTTINDPLYVSLVQKQKKLKDDTEMVEDSLYALAKRIAQIEAYVTDEIRTINKNMSNGIDRLEQRDKYNAGTNQQYVMTGFNNLALMFGEVMDQLQQQMSQQMPGEANCKKPGNNKKPGMGMSQMQKQLNDQLDKLMKEMGDKPGMKPGEKPGDKPGQGGGGMSKEMAKAAAQQKMIRDALQQMMDAQGDKAGNNGELKKLLDEMNKTETELVNKQLTNEMLLRQQEIMTKLLEAEDAMRQRETDNKRESETANNQQQKMPPSLEEYLKKREAEIQLYKTLPPSLKPYYKNLVESYFKNIN